MPKNTILKDAEVAALVLVAVVVIGSMTFLTANHILPADLSQIADSGLLASVIGVIFHAIGLKSMPIANVENLLNQFGALVQQVQQPAPLMTAPAQPAPAPAPAVPVAVAAPASAPAQPVEAAG